MKLIDPSQGTRSRVRRVRGFPQHPPAGKRLAVLYLMDRHCSRLPAHRRRSRVGPALRHGVLAPADCSGPGLERCRAHDSQRCKQLLQHFPRAGYLRWPRQWVLVCAECRNRRAVLLDQEISGYRNCGYWRQHWYGPKP